MTSDDRVREIRLQMAQIRSAARDNVVDIVDSARLTTDWRYYVQQYPWAIGAAAVGVGYLLIPRRALPAKFDEKVADELMRRGAITGRPKQPSALGWVARLALPFVLRAAANTAWALLEKNIAARTAAPRGDPFEQATTARSNRPR